MRSLNEWKWHVYDVPLIFISIYLIIVGYQWNASLVPLDTLMKTNIYITDAENMNYLVPSIIFMLVAFSWTIRIGSWSNYEIDPYEIDTRGYSK